ncbi:hypothetical protein C2I36_14160 [Rhodobacteraceae bacterium WD3A24]|nr:hypothetical protein C2I36_14160 [Rhodobacteraceae bacterium WD3A24]
MSSDVLWLAAVGGALDGVSNRHEALCSRIQFIYKYIVLLYIRSSAQEPNPPDGAAHHARGPISKRCRQWNLRVFVTDPARRGHRALLRWLRTQDETPQIAGTGDEGLIQYGRFWHRRAPGMTCLSALCAAQRLGAPAVNDSKGCGTIMRVAPVAPLCPREDVHDLAVATSALTHGHPTGRIAAAAWAGMLADVGTGMELEEAAEAALARLTGDDAAETRDAIRAALQAPRDGEPATVETPGVGWTAEEALSIALYACLTNDDIEFGLRCAATHSGDSASTAAVAGNMMGLLHPEELLRHRWANRVQFREWFAKMNADWMKAVASAA